jgi:hypothetical protein
LSFIQFAGVAGVVGKCIWRQFRYQCDKRDQVVHDYYDDEDWMQKDENINIIQYTFQKHLLRQFAPITRLHGSQPSVWLALFELVSNRFLYLLIQQLTTAHYTWRIFLETHSESQVRLRGPSQSSYELNQGRRSSYGSGLIWLILNPR